MLTSISLQNFKCYKDKTTFPLSKINLLTGINGKGKSTFLQSMLLFKQTVEHNDVGRELLLNGHYVKLGTFQDVKNSDTSKNKPIVFKFEDATGHSLSYEVKSEDELNTHLMILKLSLYENKKKIIETYTEIIPKDNDSAISENKNKHYISPNDIIYYCLLPYIRSEKLQEKYPTYDPSKMLDLFNFKNIYFVSADRLGPQEYYKKQSRKTLLEVGRQGEQVIDVLEYAYRIINTHPTKEVDVRQLSDTSDVLSLTSEWLNYILDTNVSIVIDTKSSPYISTLMFQFAGKTLPYTPLNVGFGYSYILPIIVAGLVAKYGEILIIENPEAHLHPGAQSRLAEFLARVASMGVQVFVESHSDHILNGLRVCVKKETLQPEDVQIFYFDNDENSSSPKIFTPQIDKDGRIEEWPDGFFDEWNNNLMELL